MKTFFLSLLLLSGMAHAQEYYDYQGSVMNGNGYAGTLSVDMTINGPVSSPTLVGYIIDFASNGFSESIRATNCGIFGGCGGMYGHSAYSLATSGNVLTSAAISFSSTDPNTGEATLLSIGPSGDSFSYRQGFMGGSGPGSIDVSNSMPGVWTDPPGGIRMAPELHADGMVSSLMLLGCCLLILVDKRLRNS